MAVDRATGDVYISDTENERIDEFDPSGKFLLAWGWGVLNGAEEPNPSSRQVADAFGVTDQGQMSKLLWRLESLGLIANDALITSRGEPNAWSLTALGAASSSSRSAQRLGCEFVSMPTAC
jgi:hypothetical protein